MFSSAKLLLIISFKVYIALVCTSEFEVQIVPNTSCSHYEATKFNDGFPTSYIWMKESHTYLRTFYGHPYNSFNEFIPCEVIIKSNRSISISITGNKASVYNDIHFEHESSVDAQCRHRIAVLKYPLQDCYFNWHSHGHSVIRLHVSGNITIGIAISDIDDDPSTCFADAFIPNSQGERSTCVVDMVDTIIACKSSLSDSFRTIIDCDLRCRSNCSFILGSRNVLYECDLGNGIIQSKSAYLAIKWPGDELGSYTSCTLDMSSNGLTTITKNSFLTSNKIDELNLSFNAIHLLSEGVFNGLDLLEYLDLRYNHIGSLLDDVFSSLGNLQLLDLGHNAIEVLSQGAFRGLHQLEWLTLDHNHIQSLSQSVFGNLRRLYGVVLKYNAIEVFSEGVFNSVHQLRLLYLDDNRIKSLLGGLFNNLAILSELRLSFNYIDTLPEGVFNGLKNLKLLTLFSNLIKSVAWSLFRDCDRLASIDLSNNSIDVLSVHNVSIYDFRTIRFLFLSENRLTEIPKLSFMTNLKTIDLQGNPLTDVTQRHFDSLSETVNVYVDQPVICECFLKNKQNCLATQTPSPYFTCDRLLSTTVLTSFTWVLGVAAVVSNVFALTMRQVLQRAQQNNVQALLLSNLAVSDLLMGIYMIIIASADVYYGDYFPINAENWRLGVTCKIASMLVVTSSEASVLFVTLISVDRFINIKFPYTIHKLRIKSTPWVSFAIWCVALSLALVATIMAGQNQDFYDNSHVCIGLPLARVVSFDTMKQTIKGRHAFNETYELNDRIVDDYIDYYETFTTVNQTKTHPGLYYSVATFIGLNMICFLLILFCYIVIIATVFKTSKEASRQREIAEEIRMTLKVSAIVLTDFCCWFPITLIGALVQAGVVTIPPSAFAWTVTFVLPINSSINPLMYTLGSLIGEKCAKRNNRIQDKPLGDIPIQ